MLPKFRAFDHDNKVWLDNNQMLFLRNDGTLWLDNQRNIERPNINSNIEVSFYTGIKDANNQEIAIGDIVENYRGDLAVVIYQDLNIRVKHKNGDFRDVHRKLKIVGNIFENENPLKKG